jgi:CDP-paratose 2-epimerase
MSWSYTDDNRAGDHVWWISDVSKFRSHFPEWRQAYSVEDILAQIIEKLGHRLHHSATKISAGDTRSGR